MLEWIIHFIGGCPCSHSHLDIKDLFLMIPGFPMIIMWVKLKLNKTRGGE